jgi:hypothetical protein
MCLLLACHPAAAREICHFAGTSDYEGRIAATTDISETAGLTTVDVTATLDATMMFWVHMHYLAEEISIWRDGELLSVAVNNRSFSNDRIIRQQWDAFSRTESSLQAHRVQAKTMADFRAVHPGFVQHWDPATFGEPWVQDFPAALPERRPDLDLSPLPKRLATPFAMAFYWVRRLPRSGQVFTIFLPGFKTDKLVDLAVTGTQNAGGMVWHVPLRTTWLNADPASSATAWTSPDGHLQKLAFEVHGTAGSARGLIEQQGCASRPQ